MTYLLNTVVLVRFLADIGYIPPKIMNILIDTDDTNDFKYSVISY